MVSLGFRLVGGGFPLHSDISGVRFVSPAPCSPFRRHPWWKKGHWPLMTSTRKGTPRQRRWKTVNTKQRKKVRKHQSRHPRTDMNWTPSFDSKTRNRTRRVQLKMENDKIQRKKEKNVGNESWKVSLYKTFWTCCTSTIRFDYTSKIGNPTIIHKMKPEYEYKKCLNRSQAQNYDRKRSYEKKQSEPDCINQYELNNFDWKWLNCFLAPRNEHEECPGL